MVDGIRISRSARSIASTAVPSATPAGRLKEIVTEGNCPEWFTVSGDVVGPYSVNAASGTS